MLTLRQTYFVDNATTSGHTLEAARAALGLGVVFIFAVSSIFALHGAAFVGGPDAVPSVDFSRWPPRVAALFL